MLVVVLQLRLGRQVIHFGPDVDLQPADKAPDLLLLLLIHLQHPLRQEGEQVVHHIRFLLLGDEVAQCIFGQAGIQLGQYFGVLAFGVKLLQLRHQVGTLGLGSGEGDAADGKSNYVRSLI